MHCVHTAEDSVKLHVHPDIDIALVVLIHNAECDNATILTSYDV